MKRVLVCLTVLCCLLLTACGGKAPAIVEGNYNGRDYVVDTENGTVTMDGSTYTYTLSVTPGQSAQLKLTYPDGTWSSRSGRAGNYGISVTGTDSTGFVHGRYLSCDALWYALDVDEQIEGNAGGAGYMLLGVVLVLVGLFQFVSPETMWKFNWGWRFKNAEPSDFALKVGMFSGALTIVLGIIVFFGGGFGG